ncbi:unnamed protein product [Rhizoctonia solani]|uniref:Uncharacterized protein n=1 Tax=Rhizoctonia solani TaxID=456999 RepID=A0A8H2X648_9AGAM|nr:unnamed protein product [Rhizoctonia solani]
MSSAGPTSPAKVEPYGEGGYYEDPLQGIHQSLSFMGKRPLFILKDERLRGKQTPRAKKEDIEIQPLGLVQWKVPHAGPGLISLKPKQGEKEPDPEYAIKMAMMNADLMGAGGEDEEELNVVSSDDEDGIQLEEGKGKGEDDGLTVYYPLIRMPCRDREKELREVLSQLQAGESCGAIGRFAKEWLDEIERADKVPTIHVRQ